MLDVESMLTPEQVTLGRHALGLPNCANKTYRNRYFADASVASVPVWREMVARHAATEQPAETYILFRMTKVGAEACLLPGERLCEEDFPCPS